MVLNAWLGRGAAAKQREAVLAAARASLERLEAGRRVFLRGRALALAQRMALYARDELAMSNLRIRVRLLGCFQRSWPAAVRGTSPMVGSHQQAMVTGALQATQHPAEHA